MKNIYGTIGKTESEYVPTDGSNVDRYGLENIRKSSMGMFGE